MSTNHESNHVAAVCGAQVRIYGAVEAEGRRRLMRVMEFPHYGAAKTYAQDFDDHQRGVDQKPAKRFA